MEGDYLLSQKKFAPAAASYRRAMQLEPSAQAVVKLHAALTAAGKNQDADREAEAWLRKQPGSDGAGLSGRSAVAQG